jgi:hypothetical protein
VTRDPIVPGDTQDRTGTRGILRRAVADINRRWAGMRRDVLGVWDGLKVLTTNAETDTVVYTVTPEEMAATNQALRDALERWIEAGREAKNAFWYDAYSAEATQAGATQSLTNLTRLSPVYAAQRDLQRIVFSQPYRTRVALAQIKSYDHWTGLQASLRSELSQVIGRAIVDGRNPRAVRTEIAERLEVSRGRAAGYAQTDITDTLRRARLAEDQWAEDELSVRTGELWTSALIPTTRSWHASRNGKVYTREQVSAFYQVDGNRYRCHCSVTACLLDADGKPILTPSLRGKMAAELTAWKKTYGDQA